MPSEVNESTGDERLVFTLLLVVNRYLICISGSFLLLSPEF